MAAAWRDPAVAVGRELTKLHEEILRGPASEVASLLDARPGIKGELAIAVSRPDAESSGGRRKGVGRSWKEGREEGGGPEEEGDGAGPPDAGEEAEEP